MPTNWKDFLGDTTPRVAETYPSGKNRLTDSNALIDTKIEYPNASRSLISQVIQKAFPQYVNRNNTKVTDNPAEDGALASYGGLGGDKINAGKVPTGNISTYSYKGQPVTGAYGATSDDVMEGVEVMLHELYHGRVANNPNATPNSNKLGKDWQNMLKDAQKAGFPSVGTGIGGGDNLEEFLATAVPISQMRQMGMTPTGRFKDIPDALTALSQKYTWLPDYIKQQSDPESQKAPPSALDSATSWLQNILK
jgi:hypothetical protein